MYLNKVIVSYDNPEDIHYTARFCRYLSTLVAMGKIKEPVACVGYWQGVMEPSYMMDYDDYSKYVKYTAFVEKQECVLVVPGDTRQPCTIEPLDPTRLPETVAPMRQVGSTEGLDGWTVVLSTGKVFTCS